MSKGYLEDDWQNAAYYEQDASDVLTQISSGTFWDDPDGYYDEDEYREDEEY